MQRLSHSTVTLHGSAGPKRADTAQKSSIPSLRGSFGARGLQAESAALEGTSRMWPLPAAGAHQPAAQRIKHFSLFFLFLLKI